MLPLWYFPKSGIDNSLGLWCQYPAHTPQRLILLWRHQSKRCLCCLSVARWDVVLLQQTMRGTCHKAHLCVMSLLHQHKAAISCSPCPLYSYWKDTVYMYRFPTSSSPHSHVIWRKLSAPSFRQEEQVSDPLSLCWQCGVGERAVDWPLKTWSLSSKQEVHPLAPTPYLPPKLSNFHTSLCSKRCLRSRVAFALWRIL